MTFKSFKLFLILVLPLTMYANTSYAECARNDIDHYLNKGFTPEQITSICATTPLKTSKPEIPHDEDEPEKTHHTNQDTNQTTAHEKNEQFLKEAIKGRNVTLTKDSLEYTLKVCIEYGDEDLYGFAPKACPIIRYTIARKGLEITKSQKKYIFFGAYEIKIKSTIKREIISGLENNKSNEIILINEKLETGDHTFIPVRDDISIVEVEQVLLQLSH
ncbi:MAG: hypothetical protein OEY06_06445 [Gammaproteobacteria bacterium]|nr:hypothetical protein [Gammaproteobacteria bacterium]